MMKQMMETTKAIIENLLLVSDKPLTTKKVQEILGEDHEDYGSVKDAFDELISDYKTRSINIEEVAMGYRFTTRPDYSEWIKKFFKIEKGKRLSPAAIEVLSIIAYRQPITKAEIDSVRGVDSGGVIRSLFDKKLVRGMGRKKVVGKPLMYGTSNKFLEYFGLKTLSDLPRLSDLSENGNELLQFSTENSQEPLSFPEYAEQEDSDSEDEIGEQEEESNRPENEKVYDIKSTPSANAATPQEGNLNSYVEDVVEVNENEETIGEERDI
jgi:segregation and condensation protein B